MQSADLLASGRRRTVSVVIAGGGTGGHLFPGVALGRAFIEENRGNRILFVGAGRPLEKKVLDRAGFAHRTIAIEGIKGRGWGPRLRAVTKIPGAVFHSGHILSETKADLVVAVGGYACGPVALAAWLKGIPMVICEQNTIPGVTNRILFPLARRIYVSFEQTRGKINPGKKRVFGNPIRQDLLERGTVEKKEAQPFTILIVGGSQGAHAINRAVMDAIPLFQHARKTRFIHQTGAADREAMQKVYQKDGIAAVVGAFFHDMASFYGQADLVICRAGATTIAEITALGKAALFIPYPFAADNHQEHNAKTLVGQQAAEMILEKDLTGAGLAASLDRFVGNPALLASMASRSKALGKPDAAKTIVADCYHLMENRPCM